MTTLANVLIETTYANLPAAGMPGRTAYTTDTLQIYYDNGASWDNVTPALRASAINAIQQQIYLYAADTGAANAYAVALNPAPTLIAGSVVFFKAANANTGASTLAVNGGAAIAIKKQGSVALAGGEIAGGQIISAVYDGANFQLLQGATGTGDPVSLPFLVPSPNTGAGTEASPFTDSSDNAAGIQNAINALAGGRGGQVLLEAARYDVTAAAGFSITTNGTQLVGVAGGANIQPDGLDEGVTGTKIRSTSAGITLGPNSTTPVSGVRLEELYLWGATSSSAAAMDIVGYCDQLVLNRVRVGGNWAYGLRLDATLHANAALDACHFLSLTIDGIAGSAVYITGNNAARTYFDKFTMCEFDDNQGYGFYVENTEQSQNFGAAVTQWMRLESCSLMRNGQQGGTDAANIYWYTHQGIIANCVVWEAGCTNGGSAVAAADGVIIGGNSNIVSGCQFSANNGYGIRVRGNNNIILGNQFAGNAAGNILIEAGATGNIIIQPGLSGITDNGTGTIYLNGIPATAEGDLIVGGVSGLALLAPGSAGDVLTSNGAGNPLSWGAPTGTAGNATEIQGVAVSSAAPTSAQVLQFNGTEWAPGSGGGGGGYTQIAQVKLGAAQASISFSSIPQNFTNLKLFIIGQSSNSANDDVVVQFNGDTGNNYDWMYNLPFATSYSNGHTNSTSGMHLANLNSSSETNQPSSAEITIHGYASTTWDKTAAGVNSAFGSGATAWMTLTLLAGDWRSTAAVASILLTLASGANFVAGTIVTLYGME